MNKLSKIMLFFLLCTILNYSLTSCSSTTSSTQTTINPIKTHSTLKIKKPSDVFEFYKKVDLGMTKDQVDKTLPLQATADTSEYAVKGTYNYIDSNTSCGVCVIYNDKNIAFSKSVIYGSHSDIAPLCKKAVKESQKNKITTGMAYTDVITILGGEGVECSRTGNPNDASFTGVIRRWANKNGSNMQIVFSKDDKVQDVMYFNHN